MKQKTRTVNRWVQIVALIAAAGILLVMTWLTLGHSGPSSHVERFDFVPFVSKANGLLCMLQGCMSFRRWLRRFLIDTVGNVLLFVPFGAATFVALYERPRPLLKATLLGLALSALFETLQIWIPGRVVAVDDLVLNTLGAALGAGFTGLILNLYRAIASRMRAAGRSPYQPADKGD